MVMAIAVDKKVKDKNGKMQDSSMLLIEGRKLFGTIHYDGKKYIRVRNQEMADDIDCLEIHSRVFQKNMFLNYLKCVAFKRDDVELMRSAFQQSNLENIDLPTKSKFHEFAFAECYRLKSVSIPKTMNEIPAYAFYNDKNLTSVKLEHPIWVLRKSCFDGCSKLDFQIPKTVSLIEKNAMNWTANRKVRIPDVCLSVESGAFSCMPNLEELIIENPTTMIAPDAFAGCIKLSSVCIEHTVYPVKVDKDRNLPYILIPTHDECVHGIHVGMACRIGELGQQNKYFYYAASGNEFAVNNNRERAISIVRSRVMNNYHKRYKRTWSRLPADHHLNISLQEMYCINRGCPRNEKLYPESWDENKRIIDAHDCGKCQQVNPAIYRECINRYFGHQK